MNLCPYCHDRYADTDVHNCWVLMKRLTQENLTDPPYEWVPARRPKTDAEFKDDVGQG